MYSTDNDNAENAVIHRPGYSRLADVSWQFVDKTTLDECDSADWALLNTQRAQYQRELQAKHVMRLLSSSADDPSFGYPVNMYRHALQAATMAMRDGLDEELIVVTLLHDVGFITCPASHGEFAAQLLRPYISDRNFWMLERHAIFQEFHVHDDVAGTERHRRERWRGHRFFEFTANWVDRYDQNAQDAGYDAAPLREFEAMVYRIFSREPKEFLPD